MNNEIKTISPFKNFCMTIGNLPTSYLESMSYYETLCWLIKYLENTIKPAVNQNAEALKELQEYVSNYFDNLDVTDEINAKLDDMAESGELAEIINVEMIGTLSNLTTTDKTDLVHAINEVDSNIKNINLTSYVTYETFTSDYGNASGHITVAKNSDGSLAKVYGVLYLSSLTPNTLTTITLNADTGLNPTDSFLVEGTTIIQDPDKTIRFAGIRFNTNGKLNFVLTPTDSNATIYAIASLIYVKDFGDVV
ncbi:MAG: hypothetical protein J6S85_04540 [Methanobrevibacter sp.]|nr:hypothetical protein [Methanobrevibacter sp.]